MNYLKAFIKLNRICGWLLIPFMILFFITGYAIAGKYSCNKIIDPNLAFKIHSIISIPAFICFFLHVSFSMSFSIRRFIIKIKKRRKNKGE